VCLIGTGRHHEDMLLRLINKVYWEWLDSHDPNQQPNLYCSLLDVINLYILVINQWKTINEDINHPIMHDIDNERSSVVEKLIRDKKYRYINRSGCAPTTSLNVVDNSHNGNDGNGNININNQQIILFNTLSSTPHHVYYDDDTKQSDAMKSIFKAVLDVILSDRIRTNFHLSPDEIKLKYTSKWLLERYQCHITNYESMIKTITEQSLIIPSARVFGELNKEVYKSILGGELSRQWQGRVMLLCNTWLLMLRRQLTYTHTLDDMRRSDLLDYYRSKWNDICREVYHLYSLPSYNDTTDDMLYVLFRFHQRHEWCYHMDGAITFDNDHKSTAIDNIYASIHNDMMNYRHRRRYNIDNVKLINYIYSLSPRRNHSHMFNNYASMLQVIVDDVMRVPPFNHAGLTPELFNTLIYQTRPIINKSLLDNHEYNQLTVQHYLLIRCYDVIEAHYRNTHVHDSTAYLPAWLTVLRELHFDIAHGYNNDILHTLVNFITVNPNVLANIK
jgi:hypothetical protein